MAVQADFPHQADNAAGPAIVPVVYRVTAGTVAAHSLAISPARAAILLILPRIRTGAVATCPFAAIDVPATFASGRIAVQTLALVTGQILRAVTARRARRKEFTLRDASRSLHGLSTELHGSNGRIAYDPRRFVKSRKSDRRQRPSIERLIRPGHS